MESLRVACFERPILLDARRVRSWRRSYLHIRIRLDLEVGCSTGDQTATILESRRNICIETSNRPCSRDIDTEARYLRWLPLYL